MKPNTPLPSSPIPLTVRDSEAQHPTPTPGANFYDSPTWHGPSSAATVPPAGYNEYEQKNAPGNTPPLTQRDFPAKSVSEKQQYSSSDKEKLSENDKVDAEQVRKSLPAILVPSVEDKPVVRNFSREDEEELVAYWSENHTIFNGKLKKKFLEGAVSRLNRKYAGQKALFAIQKVRKKCDYMRNRFNQVRDKMLSSGFGIEDLTSKPDLRATVLSKFPLYEAMEQFMLEKVNVNPVLIVEAGAAASATSKVNVRGTGASKFRSDLKKSKEFGLLSDSDDDDDIDENISAGDNPKEASSSVDNSNDKNASNKKPVKAEKDLDKKEKRCGNPISSFIDIAKHQMATNNSFKQKMLKILELESSLRKEEAQRESKTGKIQLLLSIAEASRNAGDTENDKEFRGMAAKLSEDL